MISFNSKKTSIYQSLVSFKKDEKLQDELRSDLGGIPTNNKAGGAGLRKPIQGSRHQNLP